MTRLQALPCSASSFVGRSCGCPPAARSTALLGLLHLLCGRSADNTVYPLRLRLQLSEKPAPLDCCTRFGSVRKAHAFWSSDPSWPAYSPITHLCLCDEPQCAQRGLCRGGISASRCRRLVREHRACVAPEHRFTLIDLLLPAASQRSEHQPTAALGAPGEAAAERGCISLYSMVFMSLSTHLGNRIISTGRRSSAMLCTTVAKHLCTTVAKHLTSNHQPAPC